VPVLPTVLLGIGLGGFFDGIVLHQILQWHHLLSEPIPPTSVGAIQVNTLADGVFHAATWIISLAGLGLLWRRVRAGADMSWLVLLGGMLAGWGGFNVGEGLIDHQLLRLHHVRPGPDELAYDIGYLVWGAVMLAGGVALLRRAISADRLRH
jgi:uncharacterized membrane protein